MANIFLAVFVLVGAMVWRRSGFAMPPGVRVPPHARGWPLFVAGALVVLLIGGYSLGDVIAGRTQVSRSPVRYATRLHGADAHHHDVADPTIFWRQVLYQSGVGILVGVGLMALSGIPRGTRRVQP